MLKEVMVVLKVHLVIKEQWGTEKFGCKVFNLSFYWEWETMCQRRATWNLSLEEIIIWSYWSSEIYRMLTLKSNENWQRMKT